MFIERGFSIMTLSERSEMRHFAALRKIKFG